MVSESDMKFIDCERCEERVLVGVSQMNLLASFPSLLIVSVCQCCMV